MEHIPKSWRIKEILNVAAEYLEKKDIDSPRLTAEVLLAHLLQVKRITLYLDFERPLTTGEVASYRALIRRRIAREPLQYITGRQEFWSLTFSVNRDVLIPRPETEILVEQALKLSRAMQDIPQGPLRILDLGTGSGILSIVLALELPNADILATDISERALTVARSNAQRHSVSEKIHFLQGDLWGPLNNRTGLVDLLVSNPPYVATLEWDQLAPEVRDWEPRIALEAREQGRFFLKRIIDQAHHFVRSGGWVLLELAPQQGPETLTLAQKSQQYREVMLFRDYSGQNRVLAAQIL